MQNNTDTRTHHSYSPSTLQSLEACPCYRGKESTHERTIAGSRAHAVTESRVDDARLSDEDAEAAAECLDFYESRRQLMEEARVRAYFAVGKADNKEYSPTTDTSKLDIPAITELLETYLPVDTESFNDSYTDPLTRKPVMEHVLATTAGYVDRALIAYDKLSAELFDWKFGFWPVEAANNNLQGIAYALGLFGKYPTIRSIIFWFKQPHLDSISRADFTRDNIAALYLRVQTVVARAREARHRGDFSTAQPAVPICNFCALIGVCPKVAEFSCKVGSKFFPLEIPENITPTMLHTTRDTTLGMRLASVVSVWAEAFRRQTTDRVLRGDADIPAGFIIQQSSSKREVASPEKFKEVSLRYITEIEYNGLVNPPGFGKIEDVIKEKSPRGQKKVAVQNFKKELEDSGAIAPGTPFTFLKAVADTTNKTNENQ